VETNLEIAKIYFNALCSILALELSGLSCFNRVGHLTPPSPSNSEPVFVQLNIGMVIHGFANV
jgi:hypothetical protein